jgi:DNA-binding response OmpR family regulator
VKTVLVVGRDWKFRALLRAQLREEGYDALGFEALQDAESEAAVAAALLFDTTDARPDEWHPVLQRLSGQLPVVVVANATEAAEIPGARVLRRPLSVADVVQAVHELI